MGRLGCQFCGVLRRNLKTALPGLPLPVVVRTFAISRKSVPPPTLVDPDEIPREIFGVGWVTCCVKPVHIFKLVTNGRTFNP